MSEVVLKSVEDGVAVLTLNRPDRLNAWTPELGSAYFATRVVLPGPYAQQQQQQ